MAAGGSPFLYAICRVENAANCMGYSGLGEAKGLATSFTCLVLMPQRLRSLTSFELIISMSVGAG